MIVDASALLPYLVDDSDHGRRAREVVGDREISAPALVDLELLSSLRRQVTRGILSERRAAEAISDLQLLDLDRIPHELLLERVWQLRQNLTPYDASYVALAERLGQPLLTCDERLANSSGPTCEFLLLSE
ncbi:MAG: type II toxin-antitoxin system VapC family toxin [Actinobacteria bacterium]|nr:type II toxin-antitoxin system VapC family toxin [Actinomycetota bacterium]